MPGERQAEAVLADRGYDSDAIVEHIEAMRAQDVILHKCNRIERWFSRLKHFHRFATRYERSRACIQSNCLIANDYCLGCRLYSEKPWWTLTHQDDGVTFIS